MQVAPEENCKHEAPRTYPGMCVRVKLDSHAIRTTIEISSS